ncbi:MAG: TlpA disulfide reductase family protein [Candidatus Margulisiibacteriota bacterium]
MEPKKPISRLLLVVSIFVLFLGLASAAKSSALAVGSSAPDLSFKKLNGAPFDLSSLRGKPVLLSFYTTWSESCLENLKFLSSLNKSLKGVEIVTVAFENKSSTVTSFLKKHNLDLLTLLDVKKTSISNYQILIIPMTFLIDSNGTIDKIYVDFDDSVKESMKSDIKLLLSN